MKQPKKSQEVSSDFKISECTANFLTLKNILNDLYDKIVDAYQSMYSEMPDDEYNKVGDALMVLHEIVDGYIINSINENFGYKDCRCII